jgi:hypothetical protein
MSLALAVLVAVAAAAQSAGASKRVAQCSNDLLRVIAPQTQGTAAQAVAFLSILNRGVACQLTATASLTVVRDGARVLSIHGNPVSYRISQTIAHGTSPLFDAWWSNWCGSRSGLRVRGGVGALTASGPYHVLPVCLARSAPSRLTGVRYSTLAGFSRGRPT